MNENTLSWSGINPNVISFTFADMYTKFVFMCYFNQRNIKLLLDYKKKFF